jgi:hypothetical protein
MAQCGRKTCSILRKKASASLYLPSLKTLSNLPLQFHSFVTNYEIPCSEEWIEREVDIPAAASGFYDRHQETPYSIELWS